MSDNMQGKILIKGHIVSAGTISETPQALRVENGVISGITKSPGSDREPGLKVLDFGSSYICPGFIDLHVHGAGGADIMDGTPEAVITVAGALAKGGTTSFLAATMTSPRDRLINVIENLASFRDKETGGAELLGIHLEGPYLNPAQKGAHMERDIRPPCTEEFAEYADTARGSLKMMTIAPEMPGASEVIKLACSCGCIASLGHTAANAEQVYAACDAGLRHATHIFNAMGPFHHRDLGTAGAVMFTQQLTADVIPDGVHVHPEVIRMLALVKGVDMVCAVTDCMRAGGLGDGVFELGGQEVTVKDSIARLADGTIAGSTLSMARAVSVLVKKAGLSLPQAVQMAAANPARVLGLKSKGLLLPGMDADIVVLDQSCRVLMTMVRGKAVYVAAGYNN